MQPPRAHGEVIEDRTVSFLELFYDLVYVVLIAQAAHTLAGDVTWEGLGRFSVVFGLIWIAWLNGSLYQEIHGREDGRSRMFIFGQMFLLVVLAVYAGHAADSADDGRSFALTYALLLGLLTIQWYGVRRVDDARYDTITARYLLSMIAGIVVMLASMPLEPEIRTTLWGAFIVAWIAGGAAVFAGSDPMELGVTVTDSMAERFGLFTIIVLGEVVVGVADGLSEAERDATTIATGLIALNIGFGFWWSFFDTVGRRLPRREHGWMVIWMFSHLPIALAIAAGGAATVSLIEHAGDDRAPTATAWLLSGSVATMLVMLTVAIRTLDIVTKRPRAYNAFSAAALVGAPVALGLGWARPTPLILVIGLSVILVAVWFYGFIARLRSA